MKFLIGTQNEEKISTAAEVLSQMLGEMPFQLEGRDVDSGYGETPFGEETKSGAHNRAKELLKHDECDYAIGIESGLVDRYGDTYEEAWCCIVGRTGAWYGYSSGLRIPDIIVRKMKDHNLQHFEALRSEEIKALLPIKDKKDTWANYSARMLARRLSFEEALRNALVQVFAPEESLYRK